MMKCMFLRRGFSEAEAQAVCTVWYQCVGPTALLKRIGLSICPRVTVFLTDLLPEGTTEDEMKTLRFKINVYHQKYTSNLVICFFHVVVWKIWYLIYWMEYVFMTYFNSELNNSGWIPDNCSGFFILWTAISKYWLLQCRISYHQSIPWKFQQHWARIAVCLFLSLMVFNFVVCMFTIFLVMSLLTHQGWLFVKEKEMISSYVYTSHCISWGLCRCL